jgi:hypothetical protein
MVFKAVLKATHAAGIYRIAGISGLAALALSLPLLEAAAGERYRHGRRAHYHAAPTPYYYVPPASPWEAWRAFYDAQAELSFARRAARANYYVATGRVPPARYFGPPTNYYAERYATEPYSYFNCPLARRGEGICAQPDFEFPSASGRW